MNDNLFRIDNCISMTNYPGVSTSVALSRRDFGVDGDDKLMDSLPEFQLTRVSAPSLFYIKHSQHLANDTSSICFLSSFCNQEFIRI